jgi:hypothetical protein
MQEQSTVEHSKMLRALTGGFVAAILTVGVTATPASAQHSAVRHPQSTYFFDSAWAAWAKADTGRMMPGYRDLSAYDTPGYCLAAMRGVEALTWRRGESDTLPQGTVYDTLPTSARDIGRACVAKMSPETVAPAQLYNFVRLALRIGDTALARQTVEYHLSVTPGQTREQGYIIADAIDEAAKNRPAQLRFIESLLPLFSKLGKEASRAAGDAYRRAYGAAHDRFDTAAMLRFSHAREALIKGLTPEERQSYGLALGAVFEDSLDIVWYQSIPNLPSVAQRLTEQWAIAGKMEHTAFAQGIIALMTTTATIPGMSPPVFKIFKHYPTNASPTPTPGRVTIVMPTQRRGEGRLDRTLAMLRRLHERYHARGLDIMLVGKTLGYAWASPPLAPEDEAKLLGWYYREHLQLPFTILIEETSFTTKPDGRRVATPSPFLETYRPAPLRGYIVGRDGTIKTFNYGFHSESELEAFVTRELGAPGASRSAK